MEVATMKRFFKPIEKEGSAKKPALSTAPEAEANGGSNEAANGDECEIEKKHNSEPLKFVTWNANSLLLRVKNKWPEVCKFVTKLDPDVIAIQEVRVPAAGTKGSPKNPAEVKDDSNASCEEKRVLLRALSSPPFDNFNVWWSLSDSKYAGTALLVKKCFKPKVSFSLDQTPSKHEPDGRVILAEFETFRLLNTYVPNNGWKEEENSFRRRRKWDKSILDIAIVHEEIDVSHPEFFSVQKLNGYIPPSKEDVGQPGFTLAERKHFDSILKEGKLIDAYRSLHKEKDMEQGFSWSGNPIGKYRGKRMRIDYFVISEKLKDKIVSCVIHGHGIELEGFYGSDHCPVSLELSPPDQEASDSSEKC